MNWNHMMGYLSTLALFIPVALTITFRLYKCRSLLALMIYYLLAFAYNLLSEHIIILPDNMVANFGLVNNLLDAPLTLSYLLYFARSKSMKKGIFYFLSVMIVFEIVVVALFGLSFKAITIIMGPGIAGILFFSLRFFVQQIKTAVQNSKAIGKALMISSTLFSYGCFSMLYLLYYVFETPYVEDSFLVYFFVATFASMILSIGLTVERKRFQKLKELLVTRKELRMLYSNNNPAPSNKKAGLKEKRILFKSNTFLR